MLISQYSGHVFKALLKDC